ncbi:hypothetical protein [Streptomyces sp. NPDC020489]|uniref:hypothetical protein n=1 Tax=Streptomyces sp. NPDC020489 TaxID=3365077 RepID=UPI00378B9C8D
MAVPAEADLLVIVGDRDAEESDWVANLWQAMPAPKSWVPLTTTEQVTETLDRGLAELRHGEPPRPVAAPVGGQGRGEPAGGPKTAQTGEHHHHQQPHGHSQHGADGDHHNPERHADHGDHESHNGHEMDGGHHGHAGHDMGGVVHGLPMADRADDRDGLRLDQLHVPLGPGLVDWPAGLILRLTLQGDIVQQAGVEPLVPTSPHPPFWNEPWLRAAAGERVTRGDAARRLCAAHLDSLGRFFAVAGWADMAARARHVRDRALARADATELSTLVRPLIRKAERSRTLRWMTTGLGPLPAEHARHLGVTGPALRADGDAHSRMLVWLDAVGRSAAACDDSGLLHGAEAVGSRGQIDGPAPPSQALLDALPGLLEGAEFACARIIVASLDPDLDELAHVPAAGAAHG